MSLLLRYTLVLICYSIKLLHGLYPIKSFGFTTNSSLSNRSTVTMRLYWDTFIYQCNATLSNYRNDLVSFSCNINNVLNNNLKFCNNTNYVPPKCVLIIWNHFEELIIIHSIIFDDNIESICSVGDINLPYKFTRSLGINFTNDKPFTNESISDLEWNCPAIKVSSIEIRVRDKNGAPNGNLNITLFWGYQILECIIGTDSEPGNLKHFVCNHSEIKLLGNNTENEYGAHLYYDHQYLVRIHFIKIVDLYKNEYQIATFCGPFQFYYWDEPNSGTATPPILCEDDYFINKNLYSYSFIEMATSTAYITTLYITFMQDILISDAFSMSKALISPAKINSFGIKTAATTSGDSHAYIDLMLYWNLDVYSCSLNIDTNDKYFYCINDININISSSYEAAFKLVIEQNHSYDKFKSNGFIIEEISVLDSSGYRYIIDTFCLQKSQQNTDESDQCTDFGNIESNLQQFETIQFGENIQMINNESIFYHSMFIEFSNSLFKKPNQSQHGYAHHIYEIKHFVFEITGLSTETMHVTVELYWHLISYKCSLGIHKSINKKYYCNSSNAIIETNKCIMYGISIDNSDHNNAVYFQNIIVYLNNGKYYGISTSNIYLAEHMTQYIEFPNNTLDFPNSLQHNIGKLVDNIKCNLNGTRIEPEHDETDKINDKLDLIFSILIILGIMVVCLVIMIISMFYYFQGKRKQDTRSPTRKCSQNHLDIKSKKSPSDIGKNIFNYKPVIADDNKAEDIEIPGHPSKPKICQSDMDSTSDISTDSSFFDNDKNEIRIIIEKKKSQLEGFGETKLQSDNHLEVIKANDDIDSDTSSSSSHIPPKNNFEINNNDDEKEHVINDEGTNKPQNVCEDSDSDDMYENDGDVVQETEQ